MARLAIVAAVFCAAFTQASHGQNYPQFRGENSDAVSSVPLPITWSDVEGKQTNVKWKIRVPGEGWSQPIVWEDRLYMTAAVPLDEADQNKIGPEVHNGGYGRDRDDLVNVGYKYQVFCIDADTGDRIWECTVKKGKPPIPRHSTNTYATETPVTNGSKIYAYFGMNGVHCVDMKGNIVWQKDLGAYEMRAGWGTASSPTLLKDRLFIQVDNEKQSFLTALNTKSGQELWRVDRDERSQYSSPIIWKNSVRNELVLGGMVYRSYDPATGNLLWQLDMNKGRSSATPIAFGDRLYIGNELRNRGGADDGGGRLFRVRPGGSGDITPNMARLVKALAIFALLTLNLLNTSMLLAQESTWNQWRGPQRDGVWPGELPTSLSNLQLAWEKPLQPSYSGPVTDGEIVYSTETVDKSFERMTAFVLQTGEVKWRTKWKGAIKVPGYAMANGSWIKSTPALAEDSLVILGMRDA